MFAKPPLRAPKDASPKPRSGSGTPDRGQHHPKRQAPSSTAYMQVQNNQPRLTDRQKQAALQRQLAIEYGNLQAKRLQNARPKSSSLQRAQTTVTIPPPHATTREPSHDHSKQRLTAAVQPQPAIRQSQSQRQIGQAAKQRPSTAKASSKPQLDLKPKLKSPKPDREVKNMLAAAVASVEKPQPAARERPQTALAKKTKKPVKKADPVSRFQSMHHEWKKSTFLQAPKGRKLELDRFNKWRQLADTVNEK